MRLELKLEYVQFYLPTKRHRISRAMLLDACAFVTIKELTEQEFPVAFVVHKHQTRNPSMKTYWDYDPKSDKFDVYAEEIRTWKSKLYKKIHVCHGSVIGAPETNLSEIKDKLERTVSYSFPHYAVSNNRCEYDPIKSVLQESNLEQITKCARAAAKTILFFDGCFWERCGEPRYEIMTFGLGHNHGGTSMFIEETYNPNIANQNYFNALQRDQAIAYGKSVAQRRGDTNSVDRIGQREWIDVLMPEMVKVRPNKQHGHGCDFQNQMEDLIESSDSAFEAGLLCLCAAMRQ